VLRIAAGLDDFWLDEIWSWVMARQASSWYEVYTRFPLDNNHLLNTWFMYFLGDRAVWFWYRIVAICAGAGTVVLAGVVTYRSGQAASLAAMLLTACSYPLILYSSEARGYGLLVFFTLASYWLARRYLAQPGWVGAGLFALATVLGLLAHLTFVTVYGALLLWTAAALLLEPAGRLRGLANLARLHCVPVSFLTFLYVTFIRHLDVGGGPPFTVRAVLTSALSLLVGGPRCNLDAPTPLASLVAFVALLLLLVALYRVCRSGDREAVFFVAAIVVLPALRLVASRPPVLFERYFLAPLALSLLLLAEGLAKLVCAGRLARVGGLALLLGMLAGNAIHLAEQFRAGRGQYSRAVAFLAAETNQPTITVASDHDFRNRLVLAYYARFLPSGRNVRYFTSEEWPAVGTEWFLAHSQTHGAAAPPALRIRGREYRLAREFPYAGLSGWRWSIHRNVDRELAPAPSTRPR
jgi:hypothetical protein